MIYSDILLNLTHTYSDILRKAKQNRNRKGREYDPRYI